MAVKSNESTRLKWVLSRKTFREVYSCALGLVLWPQFAYAIINGAPDPHLSNSSVMILTSRGSFCSSAALSPQVLITAAHCVAKSSDLRAHWRGKDQAPVLKEIQSVAVHPEYRADAIKNRTKSIDIALILLAEPLPQSFVPTTIAWADRLLVDQAVTIGGYGLSTENDPKTTGVFRSVTLKVIEPYGPSKILIWLKGSNKNMGSCTGDSGGPIMNDQGQLIAIISWAEGIGQFQCGALTQGILLGPQKKFIQRTIEQWQR